MVAGNTTEEPAVWSVYAQDGGAEAADALAAFDQVATTEQDVAETIRSEQRNRLASELLKESKEAPVKELNISQADDIWTFDMMKERLPLQGDLFQDGRFIFHFVNRMGSSYCRQRFARAKLYNEKKVTAAEFIDGYGDIVYECLRDGGDWPMRQVLRDEKGEPLFDLVPQPDGSIKKVPRTEPMPITRDNIARMEYDDYERFIDVMLKAVSGEANGQR